MHKLLILSLIAFIAVVGSCRRTSSDFVTVALPEQFSTFDTLTTEKSDAAAERVRNLMFNSLVRKDDKFDYVGELAKEINTSNDGKSITFVLRDNVKFHDGNVLTSADVKYTFEELFRTKGYKSFSFLDAVKKTSHIVSIETPDAKTVVFNIERPSLKVQLLSNLVATPIVASGGASQLKEQPIGTGPFKFVSFDQSQNTVELQSFPDYWEGAPKVAKIRLKTVTDASALQAELQTGGVDIAPNPSNLPPDSIKQLASLSNININQFDGSNLQYLGLNTQSALLQNVKIRQAIGYAIDREKIIKELLSGQAKIAHSILPESSYAYSPGTVYAYNPEKAHQLLQEAGYKGEPIIFKFASGNAAYSSFAQAIQNMLITAGFNIQIETLDTQTIRENLTKGQFQMNTGVWIGGNQDPIFMRDLFTTAKIPSADVVCCNRWRYSNPEVDKLLENAINEIDRQKAKEMYIKAWGTISSELPLFPLWYPANIVVANKRIGNVKISPSGDWGFIKDITINN